MAGVGREYCSERYSYTNGPARWTAVRNVSEGCGVATSGDTVIGGQRLESGPAPLPGRRGDGLELESGLGFRLSRLTRTMRAGWAQQLEEVDLTPPQAAVLRGIAGRPGCSLRALARTLGAEPMRAKRCIDDLEHRGLVESAHRGGDRRPRALVLTAGGRALARRVDILVRQQELHLDVVLGPRRRAGLEEALTVLEADLGLHGVDRSASATPEEPLHPMNDSSTPTKEH